VRPRSVTALYQTAARAWLTAAGMSLLLPPVARGGIWLPLHLALAGAISSAISGAMQNFMLALTATPPPRERLVIAQFGLVTSGAGLIAIGVPTSTASLAAAGGVAFVAAMAILGWMLLRAWRRSLTRRHRLPMSAYGAAVAFVLLGGTFGALMSGRAVGGEAFLRIRHAHMTANVMGFASLTVVGTLITLLPTVLRVRMPPWRGGAVLTSLVAGVALQLAGWLLRWDVALAVGGLAYAAAALGVVWLVSSVLRIERSWAIPASGLHLMAGVAWFVAGSLGLARALIDGPGGFDRFRTVFLVEFVGGFLIQVLLGAWAYLLPMQRPGHPTERRRSLAVFELMAPVQVALLNGGLALVAAYGAGWVGDPWDDVGLIAAFAGGGLALTKAWLFPLIGRGPVETERARAVWGG
jgi:nitrite reductase (NO-forming)